MRLLLAFLSIASLLGSADSLFPGEYRARRDALRKALPNTAIVVMGGDERERGDLRTGFIQQPDFLYLTGWREPGAALLLTPKAELLFLPARNEVRERYTGRKLAPGDSDVAAKTGFDKANDAAKLDDHIKEAASAGWEVTRDASPAIARLRMVKSQHELDRLQTSIDATIEAHKAAWARIQSGLYEYQVAGSMVQVYSERGCERNAYPPIVAAGPNSIVLHYMANKRRMDSGELLLMDVGAECGDYASDITRTVPVSGKFTPRQKEIYEVVLGAQKAAIAAAKPGMKLTGSGEGTLNQVAMDYVHTHGKGPHGEPLSKYYLHQLGHHVGLEVHDAAIPDVPLAPGMVVTIEPGVYIAEENIGVRIEDMILITAGGAEVLSSALPREASDIEKALSRRRK